MLRESDYTLSFFPFFVFSGGGSLGAGGGVGGAGGGGGGGGSITAAAGTAPRAWTGCSVGAVTVIGTEHSA